MKSLLSLFVFVALAASALAQRSIVVDSNAVLTAPLNFFTANSNAINAVIAGGGGGSSDWASISNKPSWLSTNAETTKANLGLGPTNSPTFASIVFAAGEAISSTGWVSGEYGRGISMENGEFSGLWQFTDQLQAAAGLVVGGTNGIIFEDGSEVPTRVALKLGASWLTNSNSPLFPSTNGVVWWRQLDEVEIAGFSIEATAESLVRISGLYGTGSASTIFETGVFSGPVTFHRALAFTNDEDILATLTNLKLGAGWLTNSNAPVYVDSNNVVVSGKEGELTLTNDLRTENGLGESSVFAPGSVKVSQEYGGIETDVQPSRITNSSGFRIEYPEGDESSFYFAGTKLFSFDPQAEHLAFRLRRPLMVDSLTNAATTLVGASPTGVLTNLSGIPTGSASLGDPVVADGAGLTVAIPKNPISITNSATFSVTNSTTLTNVTGFSSVPLQASSFYKVDAVFLVTCGAGGSKFFFSTGTNSLFAASSLGFYYTPAGSAVGHAVTSSGCGPGIGANTAGTNLSWAGIGFFVTTTNGGTLTVQFAQNGANTNVSQLLQGSVLSVTKL